MMLATATAMAISNPAEEEYWDAAFWEAVVNHDHSMDGVFFYAVLSTGVYCRPACPSRRPKRENVLFFHRLETAEKAGFRACLRCKPAAAPAADPNAELVERVCRFIENNLEGPLTLATLGKELGLSPFHLQRTFKSAIGITPRAYADSTRLNFLKAGLRRGHSVTRAMVDSGYGSSSRLYERTASQLGMTPATYRKGGSGAAIRFTVADSPLGRLLVAATAKGVCSIRFGESDGELEKQFRKEFPAASIESGGLPWVDEILRHLRGVEPMLHLPLDIQSTAFQRRVWEYLQSIPYGATQSYSEIASAIGQPNATRAVARACATNPVALAIPCHRVVRQDGSPGGYRWGLERKKALLAKESEMR